MSEFCNFKFDGLGTECERCKSWRRGIEPPDCVPYITRSEPDGKRLLHIVTPQQNREARSKYFAQIEKELESAR